MSQPTWTEIAQAIQQVVLIASDLETVIWRYQDGGQPTGDYIDLALGALTTEGVDWVNTRYDATLPEHQRIVQEVGGVREVSLELEAWSVATVETLQAAAAQSTLDKVVTRLRLPQAREALRAVGVVPFDPGPVQWIPQVVAANFRGRATCSVRCRMMARAYAEYCDWIAKVVLNVKAELPAGEADFTVSSS